MSGLLGLSQLVLAAAVLCSVAASLIVTAVYPRVRTRLAGLEPSLRSVVLFVIGSAPLMMPAVILLVAIAPPVAAQLFAVGDHCLPHHDGHAHICPVHLPGGTGSLTGWLGIGVAALLALVRFGPLLLRAIRGLRVVDRMQRTVGPSQGLVVWIETPQPIAFTVGWLRPRTLVSSSLRRRVDPAALEVLLAHEQEHRRRRDPLQRSLLELCTALLPRTVRARLLEDWRLAAEQSCDAAAVRHAGDPLEVAQTILEVERALAPAATPGVAFGGSTVAARVRSLLNEPIAVRRARSVVATLTLTAAVLIAASPSIHHGLETLLEALLH